MKLTLNNPYWLTPAVPSPTHWHWRLWRRWIVANALGELFGLGLAAAIGIGVMLLMGEPRSTAGVLAVASLMVMIGVAEGVIVGYAQWRVLRSYLETLMARVWIGATALGAFIAWMLGMLPSTIINLSATGASGPPPAMNDALMFGLAAAMGAALGIILALPQWRVLRRHVSHAVWWLPANALAWAAGMPLIFMGVGITGQLGVGWRAGLFIAATLAVTGAVVGAIEGFFLVYLLKGHR